jgi:hypothetical protein
MMMTTTTHAPLTDEEKQALAQLQHRQNMASWQGREDARLARQAQLAPLKTALEGHDPAGLAAALDEAQQGITDFTLRQKVDLIARVLSTNMAQVQMMIDAADQAEPQPAAPDVE